MESSYIILSLIHESFTYPCAPLEDLKNEIELRTGIHIPNQQYYAKGSKLFSLDNPNINSRLIEVMPISDKHLRFFINTPQSKVKLYFTEDPPRTVRYLLMSFSVYCKQNSLNYPSNQFCFSLKGRILQLEDPLSTIPNESEIDLTEGSVYPLLTEMLVEVVTITGSSYIYSASPQETVEALKLKIGKTQGYILDEQRLFFENAQLDDNKSLQSCNIIDGSKLQLYLRLRGGCLPPFFSFNSLTSTVKKEFSQTAPDWRLVKIGLSWTGKCVNSDCVAFRKEVICNNGFGVFDVYVAKNDAVCPMCARTVQDVSNCGFFGCDFKFYGVQADGLEREGGGKAGMDKYTIFAEGEEVVWRVLRIQVRP